jgi:hypothetical protein
VLSKLLGPECPQAVMYLEGDREGKTQLPDPETARLLARAIRPSSRDSRLIQGLRRVVFEWVWQMAQKGA